jgi:hypothetical protein
MESNSRIWLCDSVNESERSTQKMDSANVAVAMGGGKPIDEKELEALKKKWTNASSSSSSSNAKKGDDLKVFEVEGKFFYDVKDKV